MQDAASLLGDKAAMKAGMDAAAWEQRNTVFQIVYYVMIAAGIATMLIMMQMLSKKRCLCTYLYMRLLYWPL